MFAALKTAEQKMAESSDVNHVAKFLTYIARFDNRRHETTSRRRVAAIGSTATMRIGYAAAATEVSAGAG